MRFAVAAPPELRGTAYGMFNLVTGIAMLPRMDSEETLEANCQNGCWLELQTGYQNRLTAKLNQFVAGT